MNKTPFEGFNIPNTTPVPDIVFDELLSELTGNELKVLLYIIRRTYGFGKNADAISLSQFRKGITTKDEKVLDRGCGIEHNRTILVALASLEKKGYVIANKGQTNRGDADTTVYKLRFKEAPEARAGDGVVTPGNHVVTSSNDGSYPTSPRSLPGVTTVVTSGNQQETVLQDTDSQETVRQEESSTPASLTEYKHRKETDPALPVVKPPQQTPPPQSQVSGPPDVAPSASVASTAQTAAGADLPAMALTAKQIKQQNERRAKEIWTVVERERHTKYSRTQRELYENSKGMECLLNDEIDDETLVKALGAMDPYQGRNFTLLKFYGWMPNLTAGAGPPSPNGKPTACQDDPTLGISGLPRLHPKKPVYPDPHEQPRKGPRYA